MKHIKNPHISNANNHTKVHNTGNGNSVPWTDFYPAAKQFSNGASLAIRPGVIKESMESGAFAKLSIASSLGVTIEDVNCYAMQQAAACCAKFNTFSMSVHQGIKEKMEAQVKNASGETGCYKQNMLKLHREMKERCEELKLGMMCGASVVCLGKTEMCINKWKHYSTDEEGKETRAALEFIKVAKSFAPSCAAATLLMEQMSHPSI